MPTAPALSAALFAAHSEWLGLPDADLAKAIGATAADVAAYRGGTKPVPAKVAYLLEAKVRAVRNGRD